MHCFVWGLFTVNAEYYSSREECVDAGWMMMCLNDWGFHSHVVAPFKSLNFS